MCLLRDQSYQGLSRFLLDIGKETNDKTVQYDCHQKAGFLSNILYADFHIVFEARN